MLLLLCNCCCRTNLESFTGKSATAKKSAKTKQQNSKTDTNKQQQQPNPPKATGKQKKEKQQKQQPKDPSESVKYVGCFGSESYFLGKVYSGGTTGANFNLAYHHALTSSKKFFAVARGGDDGHAFAFDKLSKSAKDAVQLSGGGCERVCLDNSDRTCGCIDDACTGRVAAGEEHNRRWVVYEL